ncbi:caffeic acid 3-O-methyltransferase-like isoform X1 [Gossypium australe]|uniref:Caffeic acid 3-O-methyltransferase-like isoform X1 n=1 Tax=Gossypium australe TaxID=47621 RepID=A0A5B6WIF9_9ROSI|nr:caffeic acid 3-O-methyltransferase-like isoform X1 [Gossypium australe]
MVFEDAKCTNLDIKWSNIIPGHTIVDRKVHPATDDIMILRKYTLFSEFIVRHVRRRRSIRYAWYLRSSHMFSYVLDAAVQLGVFDILTKAGPYVKLSSNQIASDIRAKNPDAPSLLDRMLRLLACYGLVTCVSRKLDAGGGNGEAGERVYGVSLAGKAFVNDEHNGSLAAFTSNKADIEVWLRFKDLVLEGGNLFEKVHGMPAYQYKSLNPEYAKIFNTAMTNLSKIIMKKILERYNGFQGVTTLVDVGGGYGVTLNMIISKYPSIKGINYELLWCLVFNVVAVMELHK